MVVKAAPSCPVASLELAEDIGFRRERLMLCLVCFFSSLSQVNDLLLKYMKKIALPFLAPEAATEDRVIQSKLALGLTILMVLEDCSLFVLKSDLAELCSLLCLDQVSPQDVQNEIHHIKQDFAGVTK